MMNENENNKRERDDLEIDIDDCIRLLSSKEKKTKKQEIISKIKEIADNHELHYNIEEEIDVTERGFVLIPVEVFTLKSEYCERNSYKKMWARASTFGDLYNTYYYSREKTHFFLNLAIMNARNENKDIIIYENLS